MNKKNKILFSIVFTLIPIFYILIFYNKLPNLVPTRFDFSGNVTSYTNKKIFLFMPLFMALIHSFTLFIIHVDPKNKNISRNILNVILIFMPILSNFITISTILFTLKYINNFSNLILILIGILFIILGNYLPKLSSSYTIGIRTPWSLNDEENWIKTHKFGALIFILVGILLIISSLFKFKYSYIFLFLLILPSLYSFILYYKKDMK